jgi:hypothetical protein
LLFTQKVTRTSLVSQSIDLANHRHYNGRTEEMETVKKSISTKEMLTVEEIAQELHIVATMESS